MHKTALAAADTNSANTYYLHGVNRIADRPAEAAAAFYWAARLQRVLARGIAFARWGDAGYYRLVAVTDPQVREAATQFGKAAEVLRPAP